MGSNNITYKTVAAVNIGKGKKDKMTISRIQSGVTIKVLAHAERMMRRKLRDISLAVEYTWDTQCRSHDAEGAFLICGTLYVVYNTRYGGRSTIQCLYDIHDTIHSNESPVMFFPKRYTSHSSIHYHPGDKQLYAWDDGYQTIYKVETRSNAQMTSK
ncbi:hypothetical protein CRENBAI_014445 [Crenichthys baileyi]|uniref:Olfactomedin-like domain-containing protein n=1 Tax=Crenichthys baileyi TaxID=28760 RepID=A0AAV9R2K9_9TELE